MAITKIQAGALPANVITTAAIDDASVTHAKLHTDMDLSSKTVTLPTLSTLNTTGNVLVGTVDTNVANNSGSGNDGVNIHPDSIRIARTDGDMLLLNRLNSDGDIIKFLKDGAAVGTIGANGSRTYMAGPQKGIKFGNVSADPCTDTGAAADNAYDLGGSSIRWKDLHLAGTSNSYRAHVKTASSGASADASADELVVEGNGNAGISILSGQSNVGSIYFGDAGVNWDGYIAYSQASRTMTLGTAAGGGSVTINSTGNVGIGTATPSTMLHLSAGTTGSVGGSHAGITMTNKYDNPDNSWSIKPAIQGISNTGLEIRDVTDNRSVMVFDGSGNVGIGTATPNQWASYTDNAATVLQVRNTSQRARIVINGGNGAHLDLVDYAGSANDKHMNIAVDAGVLKFGSLNDAGNAFVKQSIMTMDLGLGTVTTPHNPAFHSYGTGLSNQTTEGVHGTWNQIHDKGNNFTPGTNATFTAPVAGVYAFYAQTNFNNDSSTPFYWRFQVNGNANGIFYSDATDATWSHIMAFMTIDLSANDYVKLMYRGDPDEGGDWAHFGGYLIG